VSLSGACARRASAVFLQLNGFEPPVPRWSRSSTSWCLSTPAYRAVSAKACVAASPGPPASMTTMSASGLAASLRITARCRPMWRPPGCAGFSATLKSVHHAAVVAPLLRCGSSHDVRFNAPSCQWRGGGGFTAGRPEDAAAGTAWDTACSAAARPSCLPPTCRQSTTAATAVTAKMRRIVRPFKATRLTPQVFAARSGR